MRRMVLITKAIAKPTVQRLRLRSTSEPPPSGPCPVPTPKAPDSPASFPECMRIRKIRTMQIATWMTERMSSIAVDGTGLSVARSAERVQAAQQLHRLGPQLAIERAPVGLGQLAGAVVELGVADLAVLGLLGRLEVLAPGRLGVLDLGGAGPQRPGDEPHDEAQQHDDDDR